MNYKKKNEFILGEWEDHLVWCPTQCRLPIKYQNKQYTLYLRWRWNDPFKAYLIYNMDSDNEKWIDLNLRYWNETQLDQCKLNALEVAKIILKNDKTYKNGWY